MWSPSVDTQRTSASGARRRSSSRAAPSRSRTVAGSATATKQRMRESALGRAQAQSEMPVAAGLGLDLDGHDAAALVAQLARPPIEIAAAHAIERDGDPGAPLLEDQLGAVHADELLPRVPDERARRLVRLDDAAERADDDQRCRLPLTPHRTPYSSVTARMCPRRRSQRVGRSRASSAART